MHADTTSRAKAAGREAQESGWLDLVARAGLVAHAVVYLTIAWLAVELALGDRKGRPSSTGALRELARQPFGDVLIWAVSCGLLVLVPWSLLEAAFGHRDQRRSGGRTRKRLASAGRAVVYAGLGVSGIRVAVGSGSSGDSSRSWTARLMDLPGGRWLVALVGLSIVAFGLYQAYRAWTGEFADELDSEGRSGTAGAAYIAFGVAGCTARGVAFTIVGALFGYAAVTHQPSKAGGLDQALREVLDRPVGAPLLGLLGIGLGCFGLFTLARARHLST